MSFKVNNNQSSKNYNNGMSQMPGTNGFFSSLFTQDKKKKKTRERERRFQSH